MSALTLIAAAMLQAPAEQPAKIVVQGYGEVHSAPDLATFTYAVQGEGKTSDDALKAMVSSVARVESGLRALDATVQPKSVTLFMNQVVSRDCKAEYDKPQLTQGPCAIVGYIATQKFSVQTTNVDKVGTMIGVAGRNGATEPELDSFELTDSKPAKEQAIAKALADARNKAAAVARASGATLGAMLSANLDAVRIDEEFQLATRPPPPEPERDERPAVEVVLKPKPIETNARVAVTYAIGR